MSRVWFVQHNGKTFGPITSSQLKKLAYESKIDAQTLVRLGEEGGWNRAGSIKNLLPAKELALAEIVSVKASPSDSSSTNCLKCNHRILGDASFCPQCGSSLSEVQSARLPADATSASYAFQSLPPVSTFAAPARPVNAKKQRAPKSTQWVPVAVLTVAVFLLAGALLIVLAQRGTGKSQDHVLADTSSGKKASTSLSDKHFGDLYAAGQQALADGENGVAVAAFTRAIELDPASASSVNARGVAYLRMGRLASAMSDFDAAIKFSPDQAKFYNNRAFVYSDKDELQRAIADLKKAISLDPANEEYRTHYASMERRINLIRPAIATETGPVQIAVKQAPSKPRSANARNEPPRSVTKEHATNEVERRIDKIMGSEKRQGILLMDEFSIIHSSLMSAAIDEIEVTRIVPVSRDGSSAFKVFLDVHFHNAIFGDSGAGKFIGGLEFKKGEWKSFLAVN